METAAAIVIMGIVGLIAVTAVYRMLTGKGASDTFGCGCPACSMLQEKTGETHGVSCEGHTHDPDSKEQKSRSQAATPPGSSGR